MGIKEKLASLKSESAKLKRLYRLLLAGELGKFAKVARIQLEYTDSIYNEAAAQKCHITAEAAAAKVVVAVLVLLNELSLEDTAVEAYEPIVGVVADILPALLALLAEPVEPAKVASEATAIEAGFMSLHEASFWFSRKSAVQTRVKELQRQIKEVRKQVSDFTKRSEDLKTEPPEVKRDTTEPPEAKRLKSENSQRTHLLEAPFEKLKLAATQVSKRTKLEAELHLQESWTPKLLDMAKECIVRARAVLQERENDLHRYFERLTAPSE